mmetsp:Transcript_15139/g.38490  ORF Transcript_15139/g.38490 Transcript_15139/m.38490 type:complete len:331 (+) Transcript_15139:1396-2388(+)
MELVAVAVWDLFDLDVAEEGEHGRCALPSRRHRRQLVVPEAHSLGRLKGVRGHRGLAGGGMLEREQRLRKAVRLALLNVQLPLRRGHLVRRIAVQRQVALVDAVQVAVVQPEDWVECGKLHGRHGPPHRHVDAVVRVLDACAAAPARRRMLPVQALLQAVLRQRHDLGLLQPPPQLLILAPHVPARKAGPHLAQVLNERLGWAAKLFAYDGRQCLAVDFLPAPVPVWQPDRPVATHLHIRAAERLLELRQVRAMPGGERLLRVVAVVGGVAVVSGDPKKVRLPLLHARPLHHAQQRRAETLLLHARHRSKLLADHNRKPRRSALAGVCGL